MRIASADGMSYQHLKDRTFTFAVDAIRIVRPLLNDPLGRHLVGQVIRSSSSVAANYESASKAQSRAAFASKVAIVGVVREARELTSIAMASAQTARGRRKPTPHQAQSE
jgi:four helix bundle protein